MKKIFVFLSLITLLYGCGKDDPNAPEDPKIAPTKLRTFTNQWIADNGGAGGFTNYNSYKNYQYNFEVGTNNEPVEITLSSSDDANGTLVSSVSNARSVYILKLLNKGTYSVMAGTFKRYSVGN